MSKDRDRKINLFDNSKWKFAECCAMDIEYGDGKGNDNVISCDRYSIAEASMKTELDLLKEQNRSGKEWSEAFNRQIVKNGSQPYCPEVLMGWFCSAMMSMHDSIFNNEVSDKQKRIEELEGSLKALVFHCLDYGLKEESLSILMATEKAEAVLKSMPNSPKENLKKAPDGAENNESKM